MSFLKALITGFVCASLLSACGGGGGSDSTSPSAIPSTTSGNTSTTGGSATTANAILTPQMVASSKLTLGTPSVNLTPDYGKATLSFPAKNGAPATSVSGVQIYTISYLSDAVKAAWTSGWTGKGQTVTVIDDFTTADISSIDASVTVNRIIPVGGAQYSSNVPGNYALSLQLGSTGSHGAIVSNIAAADGEGVLNPTFSANFILAKVAVSACTPNPFTCSTTSPAWYDKNLSGFDVVVGDVSVRKTPGYAKDSTVVNDQINLGSNQDPTTTWKYIGGHIDNGNTSAAINISAGTDIVTSNLTFDQVAIVISQSNILTKTTGAAIVVAAGNSGSPCLTANLGGCNLLAVLTALAPQTASSTIVVGALEGSGSTEMIASYSVRAGALADRFILASGETGLSGVVGTSFAAPRVAGAVALVRQKYPQLSAAEAVSLILLTANKDINNDGIPDFAGVSPVYGQGKLDILKALSPLGSAAVK